jgi:hypothetical protein
MFCALCTSERGPFVDRPLGRDDAPVKVCARCDDESHPRASMDESAGYEPPDSPGAVSKAVNAGSRKVLPKRIQDMHTPRNAIANLELSRPRTPGFILVRVPQIGPDRVVRDLADAEAAIADEPWAHEARYLGRSKHHFLFERPNAKACSEQRRSADDPLAAIQKFRVS